MPGRIDLVDSTYSHFTDQVLDTVRKETSGTDIEQNSWLTVEEYERRDLLQIEGEERFEGLQRFFGAVHRLTSQKRLSRIAYVVEK